MPWIEPEQIAKMGGREKAIHYLFGMGPGYHTNGREHSNVKNYYENQITHHVSFDVHSYDVDLKTLMQLAVILGTYEINFTPDKEEYGEGSYAETDRWIQVSASSCIFVDDGSQKKDS